MFERERSRVSPPCRTQCKQVAYTRGQRSSADCQGCPDSAKDTGAKAALVAYSNDFGDTKYRRNKKFCSENNSGLLSSSIHADSRN
ncbi:hypothetical protein AVEN_171036-1 [Araneus ventricosus]|uniref:Uncharacterized protein n=1 Tax=Araneus ventricosus TaxID=182803 RepID=A0A4Y2D594_ARAVE|nr:hypothetical protein AVEN_171036-1 [Araneus ventricosus]